MGKKRYFKIKRPNLGDAYCIADLEMAFSEIEIALEEDELGGIISLEIVEMTQESLDKLPEFDGW